MLIILLIFLVGRSFYNLAFDYNKNKWGFAILGVVVYFTGTNIFSLVFALTLMALNKSNFLTTTPRILINLICLPAGFLFCWILYRILLNQWEKQETTKIDDSLDGNLV